MYLQRKIADIPINTILAEGITFRKEKKRMGFQILIDGELIWDFPYEFQDNKADSCNSWGGTIGDSTWHNFHLQDLHHFLRMYMDTPRDKLDEIEKDYVGLRDLLLACDKRRGKHSASILMFSTDNPKARKVIHYRFGRKQREQA